MPAAATLSGMPSARQRAHMARGERKDTAGQFKEPHAHPHAHPLPPPRLAPGSNSMEHPIHRDTECSHPVVDFDTLGDLIATLRAAGRIAAASVPPHDEQVFANIHHFLATALYESSYGISFIGNATVRSHQPWGEPLIVGRQKIWMRFFSRHSVTTLVTHNVPPKFICVRTAWGDDDDAKCALLALCSRRTLSIIESSVGKVGRGDGEGKRTLSLINASNNSPVLPISVIAEHRPLAPSHFQTVRDVQAQIVSHGTQLVREAPHQNPGYRHIMSGGIRLTGSPEPSCYASIVDVNVQTLAYLNCNIIGPLLGTTVSATSVSSTVLERTSLGYVNALLVAHGEQSKVARTRNGSSTTSPHPHPTPCKPAKPEAMHAGDTVDPLFATKLNAASAIADASTLGWAVRVLGNTMLSEGLPQSLTSPGGIQVMIAVAIRMATVTHRYRDNRFTAHASVLPTPTAEQKRMSDAIQHAFEARWRPLHQSNGDSRPHTPAVWAIDSITVAAVNTLNGSLGQMGGAETSLEDLKHAVIEWSARGMHLLQEASEEQGNGLATDGVLRPERTDLTKFDTLLRIMNVVEHMLRTGTVAAGGWSDVHYRAPCSAAEVGRCPQFVYAQHPITWPFGTDVPMVQRSWIQVKHSLCNVERWMAIRNIYGRGWVPNLTRDPFPPSVIAHDEINSGKGYHPLESSPRYDETSIATRPTRDVMRRMQMHADSEAAGSESETPAPSHRMEALAMAVNSMQEHLSPDEILQWQLENQTHSTIRVSSNRIIGMMEGKVCIPAMENAFRLVTRTFLSGPEGLARALDLDVYMVGPSIITRCCRSQCSNRVLAITSIFPLRHAQCVCCDAFLCIACTVGYGGCPSAPDEYTCDSCKQAAGREPDSSI